MKWKSNNNHEIHSVDRQTDIHHKHTTHTLTEYGYHIIDKIDSKLVILHIHRSHAYAKRSATKNK